MFIKLRNILREMVSIFMPPLSTEYRVEIINLADHCGPALGGETPAAEH
jgi:hypothetical protein